MEPRVRMGVRAGIIPAIAAFFLSYIVLCVGGLIAAPLAGYNAGARIGRDRTYAQQPATAGAIAGLVAGTLTAVGQMVGTILTVALEQNYLRQQLMQNPTYANSADLLWPAIILATIVCGLLEVGMAAGAGALAANAMARRMYAIPMYPQQGMPHGMMPQGYMPPGYVPPQPIEENPPPPSLPATPPPAYPPPPSFYGKPDAPAREASLAPDEVPPETDAM
jgi:hypothetical protein